MARVRVSYVRSLGQSTDRDLTGPVRRPVEGELIVLQVGQPIALRVAGQDKPWTTSVVETITTGTKWTEVVTRHSVYRVTWLKGSSTTPTSR